VMKTKLMTICAVVLMILAMSGAVLADSIPFNAPGFTYTRVFGGTADIAKAPAFSPDGTKIAYRKVSAGVTSIELYDRTSDSTTTLDSYVGDGTDDGKYFQTSPYFSSDGTKIGWTDCRNPTDFATVYDLSASTLTRHGTVPNSGSDMGNSDFLGNGNNADQWVAWEHGVGGGADIFSYTLNTNGEYVQGLNLTNTADYKEYEPDSTKAGDKILYWSGETTLEPLDTTHTLTNVEGTWTKDVDFTPIAGSTWAVWSEDETKIGVTKFDEEPGYGMGDLYVYDAFGTFLYDLTGDAVGQETDWQFFGFNFNVGDEYLFSSPAGNTQDGRDIWIATVPEPATVCLLSLGGLLLRRKRRA